MDFTLSFAYRVLLASNVERILMRCLKHRRLRESASSNVSGILPLLEDVIGEMSIRMRCETPWCGGIVRMPGMATLCRHLLAVVRGCFSNGSAT